MCRSFGMCWTTQKLLQGMGMRVMTDNVHEFELTGAGVDNLVAPYELVKTMRASILVLGPALALRRSAGVAARWLRDRRAPGR